MGAAKAKYQETKEKIKAAKCENNPGCSTLVGYCCPTLVGQSLSGVMLGCCGATSIESLSQGSSEIESSGGVSFIMLVAMVSMAVGAAVTWKIAKRSEGSHAGYVAA